MDHLLIVAHQPLASALRDVAAHAYPAETARLVIAVDVPPSADADAAAAQVRAALAAAGGGDVLMLADAFGATPSKGALAVANENPRTRLVAGVSVPMLWRVLCYSSAALELDQLVERAVGGGQSGVLQFGGARRQNQPNRPSADDQERDQHQ